MCCRVVVLTLALDESEHDPSTSISGSKSRMEIKDLLTVRVLKQLIVRSRVR